MPGKEYIRWDAPGVEKIPPGEDAILQEIGQQINTPQQGVYAECKHAYTGTHVKTLGIVKGNFKVLDNLQGPLAQGMFANGGKEHPCAMRFSSEPTCMIDDRVAAPRGLGMLVFNVEGEKMKGATPDDMDCNAQCFEMNSSPFLELGSAEVTRDVIALRLKHADPKDLDAALRKRDDYSIQDARNRAPNAHVISQDQYSQAPIRFGDHIVKYRMVPSRTQKEAGRELATKDHSQHALREWLQKYFEEHDAEYSFEVQFCEDLKDQPVEDTRWTWDENKYPFVPVAKITFPKQNSLSEPRVNFWRDHLVINPFIGLEAHRPLGSMGRIRKVVYAASGKFRREKSGKKAVFATSIDEIPN